LVIIVENFFVGILLCVQLIGSIALLLSGI